MKPVGAVLRVAYPKALSTLTRVMGSLGRAEDAIQDAAEKAMIHWGEKGIPECPEAWLVRTARNREIDRFRRNAVERKYAESPEAEWRLDHPEPEWREIGLRDDMLRLVFTCCDPILTKEAQVALTLKAVGGLSIEEIARAFLVPIRTMEQRITRAKRTIREARIPYEVPSHKALPERVESVLAVVHLIFNEGYSASGDAPIIRHELCRLAIGQARLLCRLFPGDAEVEGLLALLLLSHSRAPSRVAPDGTMIPLDRQDRELWAQGNINEGLALLDCALRRGRPASYQIQAAISAVHCRARHFEETDWQEIVRLYDALLRVAPSSVVRLNRAVAISRVAGALAGLELIEVLGTEREVTERHFFHAVRAGLLEELGRLDESWEAYRAAAARTTNASEIRYFEEKIKNIEELDKNQPRLSESRGVVRLLSRGRDSSSRIPSARLNITQLGKASTTTHEEIKHVHTVRLVRSSQRRPVRRRQILRRSFRLETLAREPSWPRGLRRRSTLVGHGRGRGHSRGLDPIHRGRRHRCIGRTGEKVRRQASEAKNSRPGRRLRGDPGPGGGRRRNLAPGLSSCHPR
jgi:RNA polymerase sigma-70 factor (ECF subfamily)